MAGSGVYRRCLCAIQLGAVPLVQCVLVPRVLQFVNLCYGRFSVSLTRRFSTRAAPNPCGVYTRSWVPALRFRGKGRYTITLRARDTGGSTSAPARRTFVR